MFQKGFIGPIGDDLPSLIPIVTGLVIFFSIFVLTLNTYNEKNDYLQRQIDMTSVARDLKGDSLILSWDQFNDRCKGMRVKRYPYNFITAIYGPDVELGKIIEEFKSTSVLSESGEEIVNAEGYNFLSQPTLEGTKNFYCSYSKIGGKAFSATRREYSVRFYPIAVQQPIVTTSPNGNATHYLVVPSIMAMVVWE